MFTHSVGSKALIELLVQYVCTLCLAWVPDDLVEAPKSLLAGCRDPNLHPKAKRTPCQELHGLNCVDVLQSRGHKAGVISLP